jgi:hypothetical protein
MQDALEAGGLKLPTVYPRDLAAIVPLYLPLAFVSIDELSTTVVEEWLARRRIMHRHDRNGRRLLGALVARAGRGVVFIDSNDDAQEQRFTAAHEVAHFIEDHVLPRMKAIKAFGEDILPVLDGERPPTPEESVSAVLNRVPLGIQVHLMDRGPQGTICSWDVEEREQRADRLALEIIAPAKAALRELRRDGQTTEKEVDDAARILCACFGLPLSAAASYASLLLRKRQPRPKLSEILVGGSER